MVSHMPPETPIAHVCASGLCCWGTNTLARKLFSVFQLFVVPLLLLAAGVGFLLLVFDGENVLLMKYNQYRITQARDEQVEVKQDQSIRGCSHIRGR